MTYNSAYKEWPSDKTFMETALPKFINKSKFASFMVTVSAHTPYVYSSEMGDKYLSLFDDLDIDKAAKRYLSKVKVVDTALEYLLETLEEEGVLDDTVLVIFGDHYPYGLSDSEYQSIAPYDISVNQEVDRTPFIIYNSQTEAQKITKYTSPLDYTPTLLNLLGIEYDPRLYFGHDIFSDDYEDFVIFPDNSWQSSKGFYNAARGEFTPNEGVETLTDDEIIKLNQEVTTLRNMSALTIKKNYFNYLFDYFEDYEKNTSNTSSEDNEETENAE
jgi:phosphoglycerol transferase MdoB-like AlkP superfamily enzyme